MTRPAHARSEQSPWWMRLGVESARPSAGCWEAGCDSSALQPVDVYCIDHERFLPLAEETSPRRATVIVNAIRLIVGGAFLLTAHVDTPVPVYLAFVGLGAALVGLPFGATRWAGAPPSQAGCLSPRSA